MSKVIFLFIRIPLYLISLLPLRVHYLFSDIFVLIVCRIFGYRRSVIITNISRAFPKYKYDEIDKIVKQFYKHFAQVIAECIWMISASAKEIGEMVECENPELLKSLYLQGKSAIIVGGHTGNWESYSRHYFFKNIEQLGFKKSNNRFAYKKIKSPWADTLMKWIRHDMKEEILVESNSLARFIYKNQDKQLCYYMLADQSPLPGSKFAVDFLNQQTLMMNGPEIISKIVGFPVLYFALERLSRGRYSIKYSLITDNPKECEDGFITQKFASLLEETIKSRPADWLWSHKRWKRSPEEN